MIYLLCSYEYLRDLDKLAKLAARGDVCIMLDSGAYTAYTKVKKVNIDKYISFIKEVAQMGFVDLKYIQLDVIGDPVQTLDNLKYMTDKGVSPIGVFTRGSDIELLEDIYMYGDLVAIGGINTIKKGVDNTLAWIFKHIGNRKAHLLGWAKRPHIMAYKPYSFDSITWRLSCSFGRMTIWDGIQLHATRQGDFLGRGNLNHRVKMIQAIDNLLARGHAHDICNVGELFNPDNWNCAIRDRISLKLGTLSYLRWSEVLRERNNSHFYLVCGSTDDIDILTHIYDNCSFGKKS